MKATKPEDIGYCVYVQEEKVSVLKMRKEAFKMPSFPLIWIKNLIGGSIDALDLKKSVFIEGVLKQFSDSTIDIFVDENGIDKGLPPVAITNNGIFLIGNVVVLASDKEGETILLGEKQVQIALNELGFYNQGKGVEVVDVDLNESKYLTTQQHPQVLKNLLGLLIEYCVDQDIQLLSRAEDANDSTSDRALVMCLHGEPEFIDSCHQVLTDFISKHQGSVEEA